MAQWIRVYISIVISAVMLGLVVVYCIKWWMPTEVLDWIIWCAMVLAGVLAIYRISHLAKMLGSKDKY